MYTFLFFEKIYLYIMIYIQIQLNKTLIQNIIFIKNSVNYDYIALIKIHYFWYYIGRFKDNKYMINSKFKKIIYKKNF